LFFWTADLIGVGIGLKVLGTLRNPSSRFKQPHGEVDHGLTG